ncbi:MAG: cobaltochelatase subunit CobN, partial [Cyanobacteria bacterium J06632_22]
MHRLKAMPGGWMPGEEGVVFVDQTPAPLVVLTAADTDIQAIYRGLETTDPGSDWTVGIRIANLLNLQQQLAIDTYADTVLSHAQGILLRLLGGRSYWSYGLEVVKQLAADQGIKLAVLPGDHQPNLDLMHHSTLPLAQVNCLWRYFAEGGAENLRHGLQHFSDLCLGTDYRPLGPTTIPEVGVYRHLTTEGALPRVAILFYRAHFLSGNTAPVDALYDALVRRGLSPIALYAASLKDPEVQQGLQPWLASAAVILNTTSFAIAKGATALTDPAYSSAHSSASGGFWQTLDVPVLQVTLSGDPLARWQASPLGLSPREVAMNVALPEVDGRIVTRAVSFKTVATTATTLETDIVTYEPVPDRVAFVAALAANWVRLQQTPPSERRIALVLANYPNRDGRLANGVGLDTPASCVEILRALKQAGYAVGEGPENGDGLIRQLVAGVTNDPEGQGWRPIHQTLPWTDYQAYFEQLPAAVQAGVQQRWGTPDERPLGGRPDNPGGHAADFAIAGRQYGNVFVGIQPSRGYDQDPSLNYHAPDLEPTHDYLAFYHWLRQSLGVHAIVHVGKHGNLEWLPGKSLALSETCYPEVALGPLPHFYPFIVNDPGEGSQAKRRAQAVIIDHLTPPLTRAELYGPLQQLESLVDEYYDAQTMDPVRVPVIGQKIAAVLAESHLAAEIGAIGTGPNEIEQSGAAVPEAALDAVLTRLDGYLCELKEAQIRDGLHVLGQCPTGRQYRDLVVAIARHPNAQHQGLSRAIAQAWGLGDVDPLTVDPATPFDPSCYPDVPHLASCRMLGDVVAAIEQVAATQVEALLLRQAAADSPTAEPPAKVSPPLAPVLDWISQALLPALQQTAQELDHLLKGLDGHYVPPGPSGAPTRNRPEVLPTGRNFYSVDIRAMPTESAWDVGRRAAEVFVETYTQDHGEYPQTLGLSMWGTAAMRTGGDDLAEALALLGVQPVWDGPSRRVVDF